MKTSWIVLENMKRTLGKKIIQFVGANIKPGHNVLSKMKKAEKNKKGLTYGKKFSSRI